MSASPYLSPIGRSRFWNWLQSTSPYPTPLAWCHTTDAFRLRAIVEAGSFNPRPCKVFGEELLYFFYGRPAYRFNDEASLHVSCRAPVVIILAPDLVHGGKRMFPFDSGAFSANRYSDWMHSSMQLCDFELECPSDAPQRHVKSFFGSNTNYLNLQAQTPDVPYTGEFEAESMVALLTDRNASKADDRRGALELQTDRSVPFAFPIVRGLIVPDELLKAPFLNSLIEAAPGSRIDLHTYRLMPLKSATQYQALLEERAAEMQVEWGLT